MSVHQSMTVGLKAICLSPVFFNVVTGEQEHTSITCQFNVQKMTSNRVDPCTPSSRNLLKQQITVPGALEAAIYIPWS